MQTNIRLYFITFALTWLVGNFACIYSKTNFWPFSSFDMFTEFSKKEDVKVIFTLVKDKDENILFQQKEYRLPVYRFWQRHTSLNTAASLNYVKTYLNYNAHVKSLLYGRTDLVFVVVKASDLSEVKSAQPLLLVNTDEI